MLFLMFIFLIPYITYLLTTTTTGKNFKDSIQPFFAETIRSGDGIILILTLCVVLFLAQCLSGYAYNKIKVKAEDKKRLDKILYYIGTRLFIVTYSIYELLAFFILNLLCFSMVLSNNWFEGTVGVSLLYSIITTLMIILVFGFLFKWFVIEYLFKMKYRKYYQWKIEERIFEGKLILDIQKQFCNILFILIVVLTYLGIANHDIDESEITLFFGLTTFVISAYTYFIAKSSLFDFLKDFKIKEYKN